MNDYPIDMGRLKSPLYQQSLCKHLTLVMGLNFRVEAVSTANSNPNYQTIINSGDK